MSILKNAIDSIQIGVEDYKSGDDRRNTSAVRNICSGILLLYKEKLCQLSPDDDKQLSISKDIRPTLNPDSTLSFKSFLGKNGRIETVNVNDIEKLFKSLKVKTNWSSFRKISKVRNDIEHFYSTEKADNIRGLISDSFMLIRDFLIDELKEEPSHLMGRECWSVLLEINEIYAKEREACINSLNKIDWRFDTVYSAKEELSCPKCQSELVKIENYKGDYPDINLLCNSCGHTFLFSEVLEDCVHNYLYGDAHIAAKDGGIHPWDNCEECGESTFVFEENACMCCCYKRTYKQCLTTGCENSVEKYGAHMNICDHCYYVDSMNYKD
jgi:hypothetical protein